MSTFWSTSDDNDTNHCRPCCRICFSSNQTLIQVPCQCSGTVGFAHKGCLQRWMQSVRNFSDCEICHGRYDKKVEGVIPKRTFVKLFKRFFRRPFYALCKFSGNFCLTAAVGYVLSRKTAPIFAYLDDVCGESTIGSASIVLSFCIISPLVVAYGYTIESTAISFRNFMFSLYDWWNYSWIMGQMSDESIDGTNNLSTTHSASEENFIISPNI